MSFETASKNSNEKEILPPEHYQEDAIDYDDYGEDFEVGPYMTYEQKLERLREFDKQVEEKDYCPWTSEEVYAGVTMKTTDEIEKIDQEQSEKEAQNEVNSGLEETLHTVEKQVEVANKKKEP